MQVNIALPVATYHALLDGCEPTDPEFPILKHAIIPGISGEGVVKIVCEMVDAARLLALATVCCQQAHEYIAKGIADSQIAGQQHTRIPMDRGTWKFRCPKCSGEFDIEVKPGERVIRYAQEATCPKCYKTPKGSTVASRWHHIIGFRRLKTH